MKRAGIGRSKPPPPTSDAGPVFRPLLTAKSSTAPVSHIHARDFKAHRILDLADGGRLVAKATDERLADVAESRAAGKIEPVGGSVDAEFGGGRRRSFPSSREEEAGCGFPGGLKSSLVSGSPAL